MPPQKSNRCGVEGLGCLDVDGVPGAGPHDLETWNRLFSKGPVRQKTRFTLATDQQRGHLQVFDSFTHGNMRCGVAQGMGNATGCMELRICHQYGLHVSWEPSGVARVHPDASERRVTVSLDFLRLLRGTRAARRDPLCIC